MDTILLDFLNYLLSMMGAGIIVGITWAIFFSWVKW